MRVLVAVTKLGFLHRFAYRLEAVSTVISAAVVVLLTGAVWNAVVEGGEVIGGLRPVELSTYVIVAWLVGAATATRLDANLANRFKTGQIAADLSRPLDLQVFLLGRDLGRGMASLLLTVVPVGALAAVAFPFSWPSSPSTWALTTLSLLLSVALSGQIAFLVGIASFRLKNVTGLSFLKATLTGLLSGAVVPLTALPDWAQDVVFALPFQAIAHIPTVLFLERLDGWGPLGALGQQLFWALVLLALCRLAWHRALRHLTIQGG